jgi:hypothetical protein
MSFMPGMGKTAEIPQVKLKQFYMVFSVSPKKDTPLEHYHMDKHDIRTMKQNVVAFTGKYVVVAEADEFWGGPNSKTYVSKVMENPTWGKLFQCAKAAQKKTLDLHHAFFESAYVPKDNNTIVVGGQEATVLRLSLGS